MFSMTNLLPFVADRNKHMLLNLFRNAPLYITEQSVIKSLLPDDTLIYAGQEANAVYFHITGKLVCVDTFDNGTTYNFTEIHPIDILGDFEAFSSINNYLVSIRSLTESTLIAINKSDFLRWMQTDICAVNIVCRLLAAKLSKELKTNREYLFLDSYDRLALYIYEFCNKLNPQGTVISIYKKRIEIADEIGFSVKTVNRNIHKLENSGFISYGRNVLKVTPEQYLSLQKYVKAHNLK